MLMERERERDRETERTRVCLCVSLSLSLSLSLSYNLFEKTYVRHFWPQFIYYLELIYYLL